MCAAPDRFNVCRLAGKCRCFIPSTQICMSLNHRNAWMNMTEQDKHQDFFWMLLIGSIGLIHDHTPTDPFRIQINWTIPLGVVSTQMSISLPLQPYCETSRQWYIVYSLLRLSAKLCLLTRILFLTFAIVAAISLTTSNLYKHTSKGQNSQRWWKVQRFCFFNTKAEACNTQRRVKSTQ